MPSDLFSAATLSAWQQRLNQSATFADAAATWSGRLLLVETRPDAAERRAWVVVDRGHCAEARTGTPSDEVTADFILAATDSTWSDLVSGRTTPATAALSGRLSLRKGEAFALIPHAKAAAALLAELGAAEPEGEQKLGG